MEVPNEKDGVEETDATDLPDQSHEPVDGVATENMGLSRLTSHESTPPLQVFHPLSFVGVHLELPSQYPIVTLQEFDSPYRRITVPIGMTEGIAIAHAAKGIPTPRPLTHELIISILEAFGLEVVTLRITEISGGIFYGELLVSGPDGQRALACRVSDGIALCLRQRPPVPITASPSVISQFGASN